MKRDAQKQKVYDAEDAAFSERTEGFTVPQMQALVDKWCASKVLRRKYPRASLPVKVTDGRSRRRGGYTPTWYGPDQIKMPVPTRSRWYLLHELAHHLTYSPDRAWHGWEFCECYLYLVRIYLGKGAEEKLRREFKSHKVRHREPRRRNMTTEQREAARQRMLAWHAERQAA